jgi:UDP-glucose 4-epimerase
MKATREANLNSLRKVLESCALAKIKHVIYLSSHSTYGAHRNNPVPLTERATQRPLPDFPFGIDKYLSEQILRTFSKDYPETKVSILRPCIVLGPTANHEAAKSLFLHRLIKVHGSDPPIQFLHEDDLARILAIIAMGEIPGEFNVAGEGVVFYREIAKIVHTKTVTLPAAIAHPLTKISRRLGIQSGTQATALSMTRYPIVLSTGKLRMTTGYRFWYTSQETLTAFANTMCL